MATETRGPRFSDDEEPTHRGVAPMAAAIDRTAARIRAAAVRCETNESGLPGLRNAVARLADLGRACGLSPEEVIVLLKNQWPDPPFGTAKSIGGEDHLKTQCVSWLIEAYFGGRAD